MTKEELIKNLKYTMKKHEHDKVDTFGTIISLMCKDMLNYLEQEPCDDCISRQAVLDLIVANHTELNGLNVVMYSPLYKDIKQLPSVTPEPKMGYWIQVDDIADAFDCSECDAMVSRKYNYCPKCGAKMESEEEQCGK